jgi:hypothetical protein
VGRSHSGADQHGGSGEEAARFRLSTPFLESPPCLNGGETNTGHLRVAGRRLQARSSLQIAAME